MTSASTEVLQIDSDRGITRFHVRLLLLTSVLTLLDGYDITALSFVAPELAKAWQIPDKSAFSSVFVASLAGMLVGAPSVGWIGDRFGRKPAIILSCTLFGVCTLAMMLVESIGQLGALRFLTGIGLGGLLPNASALNAEYAPSRYRATMIILMYIGTALGGALPGPLTVALVPDYGWRVLFLIGGVLPLAASFSCWLWLPESAKYLDISKSAKGRMGELSGRSPGNAPKDGLRGAAASVSSLFKDGLKWVTPLLWLLFVSSLMGYFFLMSWTPILLVAAKVSDANAALALSSFQIGGIVGGVCIARPTDRWGLSPLNLFFGGAVLTTGTIGYAAVSGSSALLMPVALLAGFFVLGAQLGLNAVATMIYPTAIRANGAGWALGIGRLGAILGPILGGLLIARNYSVETVYIVAACPFAIATLSAVMLAIIARRRFAGRLLTDRESPSAKAL
ncbi:MFS transporter [Bradyrhizobium jicamae]|uniref:MFS transporter n=1 Tax=Bradyrhizobium jicamae TaxID=280332 RepID=UPI001BA4AF30|nr:MFS transporter [Bradyrhizobium jicamae]MBR0755333.1 MFS transporter [Bradyrhizobium jicamae]